VAPSASRAVKAALREAEGLLEAGHLDEAALRVERALDAHPDTVGLLVLAARIAATAGDPEHAVRILGCVVSLAPDRLATHAELAKLHRRLGRLDAADAALRQVLAREPDRASALRGLEENAALRRRAEERRRSRRAERTLKPAAGDAATAVARAPEIRTQTAAAPAAPELAAPAPLAVAPFPPPAAAAADLERRARQVRVSGDVEGALVLLRQAAALVPDRLPLWRDIAGDLRTLGRLDEADEALRRILAIDPARLSVHSSLADNARRRGDAGAAAAHLAEAAAHHPGDAALRRRLIAALRQAGDADAHAAAVALMAEDFPDDVEAQVAAATVARAGGLLEVEAACLARALALAPVGAAAVALAGAFARAGRKGDVVALLAAAATAEPSPPVLQDLAALYEEVGDTDAACAAYERAIAVDPASVTAWIALAGIAARTASAARARAMLTKARAAAGDQLALDFAEFDLLRHIGLDVPAAALLDAARARAPTDARLRGRQAALDLDHGRFDTVAATVAAMETQTVRQQVAAAMAVGRLAETRWQLPEALDAFNGVLALDPSNAAGHSAAARVLVGLLRPLEARRHLAAAKQLSREDQLARGRSLNPSQSLVGQLMSECWSNPAAMQLGQAAIAADHLDAFATLVREEPDYTPGAIAFFVFLRRNGRLDVRPPPEGAASVPRRILQFWDTETLADDVVELMASWREGNPGWEHVRHTDRTARAFLDSLPDPRVRRAYRAARKPAQKADLLRLALLFHEGGVYVDADDRCTAPLDPHVAGRSLVVPQEARGSIGNNFIAAAPGHPLIGHGLELAVTAMLRGDADTIWLSTGPGLLTRALAAHLAGSEANRAGLGGDLVVLERCELRRFCAPNCKVAYKTTTRHWSKEEFGQAV
jgi:tetratricopeptide (TPR) repeat protein